MTANFAEILSTNFDTVERPKPLPVGTYLCIIAGPPEHKNVGEKQTDAFDFTLNVIQPQSDVDQAALAEMGGHAGKTLRHTQWVTKESLWRLKEFLQQLGIETEGKTVPEAIAETPGKQLYVTVKHVPAKDGSVVHANVDKTAKV